MLQTLLILIVLAAAGALIYLATLKGDYQVRRTQLVNADIDTVFDTLRDFKTWADWSPWLMHEPDCPLIFSDDCGEEGGHYSWDGVRVGAGTLTHVKLERPNRIRESLVFTRPFKSVCEVAFELEESDGATNVAWIMRGRMPFLFRFMTGKTVAMIEKDYALGLAMLAGLLDPEAEAPKLQFKDVLVRESQPVLCKRFDGSLDAIGPAMESGFPELATYLAGINSPIAARPFSAYHRLDPKTRTVVCDMAVPVAGNIDPGAYTLKELGGGKYFEVTLHGSYRFLELAWHSAIAHVRMLKLKYDSSRPPLEVYENDPARVEHSNALITTLLVPIK